MKHRDFKLLLNAGVVTGIVATPNAQGKGWHLNVQMAKPVLDGYRGDLESNRSTWQRFQPRRFASLDTVASYLVASYLHGLGLDRFRVESLGCK
jgi:hypothetical protein